MTAKVLTNDAPQGPNQGLVTGLGPKPIDPVPPCFRVVPTAESLGPFVKGLAR